MTPLLRDSDTHDFNAIAHPSPDADTTAAEDDNRSHMEESGVRKEVPFGLSHPNMGLEVHSAVSSPHAYFALVNTDRIKRAELLVYLEKYVGAVNVK
ncbi:hypothetical protein HK104_000107, partial [Borealophlyctis nickersoniae]